MTGSIPDAPRRTLRLGVLFAASATACAAGSGGGDVDAAVDAAADAPPACTTPDARGFTPGAPPAFPEVGDEGGGIIAAPVVAEVSFANDVNAARHERYLEALVASRWAGMAQEYGIGRPTLLRHTRLREAAPATITLDALRALVNAALDRGEIPGADADPARLVLMVFTPRGTAVLVQPGATPESSCRTSVAFHTILMRGGQRLALSVMPVCDAQVPGLDEEGVEQVATSHEYIESVTNPKGNPLRPGRALSATAATPWAALGAEVADLCLSSWVTEGGARYARFYSNASARLGDPCAMGEPIGTTAWMHGTQGSPLGLVPGEEVTLTFTAWSNGPSCPWRVVPEVGGAVRLDATADRQFVRHGDTLRLTVRMPLDAPLHYAAWIALRSELPDGRVTRWPAAFYGTAR